MDTAILVAVIGVLSSLLVIYVTKRLEVRSINIAVLSEVQRLLRVLEGHKRWWRQRMAANDTKFPLLAFTTPIFDLQTVNLGQIDREIVAMVVRFYGYLKFINALQSARGAYETEKKSKEFDQQYLEVLESVSDEYKNIFDSAFGDYGLVKIRL